MREIKFRAWDKIRKRFCSHEQMKKDKWSYGGISNPIQGIIPQQFTGLHDKNGKEIYEGDVFGEYSFVGDYANRDEPFGRVYFDEDLSSFCVAQTNGGWEYLHNICQRPRVSVIGNIYENPDLLTKDKQP